MSFLARSNAHVRKLLRQVRSFVGRPRVVVQQTPVVLDDVNACENPIFLIGIHRSGTSLTRRMFNCHENIACPPESFFLQHYATLLRDNDSFLGFEGMGFGREAALKELRRAAGRFHEAFRQAEGKPRWADKTPQYVFFVNELIEIFGPQAKFVVIFRHPFDIVTSIYHRRWRLMNFTDDLFENTVLYVAEAHRQQLVFLARYPEQTRPLFYEALCQAPDSSLKPLLEWLGEPWDPRMLDFAGGQHNRGTEDPVVLGMHTIELNSGTWETLSDQQIRFLHEHLGAHAEALGYPVDLPRMRALDSGMLALPAAR
jgi:hypothetical protein